MVFTSPFGGLGLTAFNPSSPNLPQNLSAKPKATPETPVPTKSTTPPGAETITALIKPGGLFKPQPQTSTVPEAQAPVSVPTIPQLPMPSAYTSFAQPMPIQAFVPTPPPPSFANAPVFPYPLPDQQATPVQMPQRLNPYRLVFV